MLGTYDLISKDAKREISKNFSASDFIALEIAGDPRLKYVRSYWCEDKGCSCRLRRTILNVCLRCHDERNDYFNRSKNEKPLCRWYIFWYESVKTGNVKRLSWIFGVGNRDFHHLHSYGRDFWMLVFSHSLDEIKNLYGSLYSYGPAENFVWYDEEIMTRCISEGITLEGVKLLRSEGAHWTHYSYNRALIDGRFDIADHIYESRQTCWCGEEAVSDYDMCVEHCDTDIDDNDYIVPPRRTLSMRILRDGNLRSLKYLYERNRIPGRINEALSAIRHGDVRCDPSNFTAMIKWLHQNSIADISKHSSLYAAAISTMEIDSINWSGRSAKMVSTSFGQRVETTHVLIDGKVTEITVNWSLLDFLQMIGCPFHTPQDIFSLREDLYNWAFQRGYRPTEQTALYLISMKRHDMLDVLVQKGLAITRRIKNAMKKSEESLQKKRKI
jgi:hypothetical protein